jgi:hypothetical protein
MESRTVSDKNDKHDELRAEVEKAEARLNEPTGLKSLSDRSPPEKVSDLIREHPGLAIAAGLGLGLLVSVLVPKGPGRKLLRRGGLVASAAADMALVLGRQALARAGEASEEGRERLDEIGDRVGDAAHRAAAASRAAGKSAQRMAREASATARERGSELAHKAGKNVQRLAGESSAAAREAGNGLAQKAERVLARLRD